MSFLNEFLSRPPRYSDALALIVFTVLITIHPYYLNDRINVFELGLYLPGINAILHGLVPYRDFFHLRGPLELYIPAWLMQIFGARMDVLCLYFFFGNVLCLIFVVLIARELMRSRYMLYLMVPAIIARTYPRVVFAIWGGMRYAWGLIAVFCFIKFLKTRRLPWIAATGIVSALAALTSIEMGVYSAAGVVVCLVVAGATRVFSWKEAGRALVWFVAFGLLGIAPWIIYSVGQHAFVPYVDAFWTIVTHMQAVIDPHLVSIYPRNFPEAFAAMVNPVSVNFKHMTPAYLYLLLAGYLVWRWRKGAWGITELALLSLGVYGFIMYNTGFRGIWASQFEMALMPEKILYFFILEGALLWLWAKREAVASWQKTLIYVLVIGLFGLSIGYSLARYNKRFWAYQYAGHVFKGKGIDTLKYRDKNQKYEPLPLERAKGIYVPLDQHKDLVGLERFIKAKTRPDDVVVMFPEMGMYNFLFDRPFLGRFPITTFAWFDERWFDEYIRQFKAGSAKYVIVQENLPKDWYQVYLGYPPSKAKYEQMKAAIAEMYRPVEKMDGLTAYQRK